MIFFDCSLTFLFFLMKNQRKSLKIKEIQRKIKEHHRTSKKYRRKSLKIKKKSKNIIKNQRTSKKNLRESLKIKENN